jgi:hypothetical protein
LDRKKVERHIQRARLKLDARTRTQTPTYGDGMDPVFFQEMPPLNGLLLRDEESRVPEKFLYHVEVMIKGSFEAGDWFKGREGSIHSSPTDSEDLTAMRAFKKRVYDARWHASRGQFVEAGKEWRYAFLLVEIIVQSRHYHILQTICSAICELWVYGLSQVAEALQRHLAQCASVFKAHAAFAAIYATFGQLDLAMLLDVEDRMVKIFDGLFKLYLGSSCYGLFELTTSLALGRLQRCEQAAIDDLLPSLRSLDEEYGQSSRRSLRLIYTRMNIMFERDQFDEATMEGRELVRRAMSIRDNKHLQLRWLFRGWYQLGNVFSVRGFVDDAANALTEAQRFEFAFRQLYDDDRFEDRRMDIVDMLERLNLDGSRQDESHIGTPA